MYQRIQGRNRSAARYSIIIRWTTVASSSFEMGHLRDFLSARAKYILEKSQEYVSTGCLREAQSDVIDRSVGCHDADAANSCDAAVTRKGPKRELYKGDAGYRGLSETASDAFKCNVGTSAGIPIHRLIIRWSQVRILAGPPRAPAYAMQRQSPSHDIG